MTLAEFYATHHSPNAIVLPRPTRAASQRRSGADSRSESKSTSGSISPALAAGALKKH